MKKLATQAPITGLTLAVAIAAAILALTVFPGGSPSVSAKSPHAPAQSDHALYGPGDTAIYCGVAQNQAESYTLHVSATPKTGVTTDANRTITIKFGDLDSITFRVGPNTSFSTTQELGGVPGVDNVVKLEFGTDIAGAMASVKVRAWATDPFSGDGESDNFCLTAPLDPGSASAALLIP